MPRQRIRARSSPLALVGRLLLVLFSLALVWYGLMLLLLAFKLAPSTVNSISGYRSAFDFLAGLGPDSFSDTARLAMGIGGLLGFLLFGWLALKELPRPYLARQEVPLARDDKGTVEVSPRALERAAEVAAESEPGVAGARGRLLDGSIAVDVTVARARETADTLRGVQSRVRDALATAELPVKAVDVTLAGFERRQRRELQ